MSSSARRRCLLLGASALACASLAACWLTSSFGSLGPLQETAAAEAGIDAPRDTGSDDIARPDDDAHEEEAGEPGDAGCLVDAYVASVLADDPMAYWRLDEDAGTVAHDLLTNYDGVYEGGVTLGVPGVLPNDTAVAFDGDSGLVDMGANLAFLMTAPFSVEAWIRPTKIDGAFRGVLSNESAVLTPRFGYLLYVNLQLDAGVLSGFERWNDGMSNPTVVVNAVSEGAWAHLVGTFDGVKAVTFYVDGSPVATNESTPVSITESGSFVIGALNSGKTPTFFQGTIDEVAVYGHPLSAACVMAHYRLGLGKSPSP